LCLREREREKRERERRERREAKLINKNMLQLFLSCSIVGLGGIMW
jgi:hypothetical protein